MDKQARVATLAGTGALGLWAFLAVLARGSADIPPLQLTAMSFAVAGLAGLAGLAASGRLSELRQSPAAWAHGVGGLFGYHALYFTAVSLAPVAEANLLNYLWPLAIVVLSALLLGLRLTVRHWIGVGLGLVGCALLLAGRAEFATDGRAAMGYAAAVGAALTWGFYSVLSRRFASVPTGAVAGFCAATAMLAGASHLAFESTVRPDLPDAATVLLLGLGPLGAAFFLWDIGMKRGDPRLIGTLAYATPILSTLLLVLAGYAPLTVTMLLAALLVAAGGLVAARA